MARPLPTSARATLRPGCLVALIDLSAGGALVQAARPLRPGARVHLQVVVDARTFSLGARVLRCAVWALDPQNGITYRGALKFEDRCESFWERTAHDGCAVPGEAALADAARGNHVPAENGSIRSHPGGEAQ